MPGDASLIDVLDRILDKGVILVDPSARTTSLGTDLKTSGARVVVATVKTHLEHAELAPTGAVLHSEVTTQPRPMSLEESLNTTRPSGWRRSPKPEA
jgi:hypothetical protein